MPIVGISPDGATTMSKPSPKPMADERISVSINAVFTIWFVPGRKRGGYQVGCHGLPEIAGWGKTANAARGDIVRKIQEGLDRRAERGKAIPKLVYAPYRMAYED